MLYALVQQQQQLDYYSNRIIVLYLRIFLVVIML
ncbi:unnamed protein product [Trichobilharzia regenti]|nr:unnamed protein product [Trichobilharzia regenti]